MWYRSGTGVYARGRWQHFYAWNNAMAAILKVWRQIENPTPSVDAYLCEEHSAKFYPDPIWNDGALGIFWRGSPQREEQDEQQQQDDIWSKNHVV